MIASPGWRVRAAAVAAVAVLAALTGAAPAVAQQLPETGCRQPPPPGDPLPPAQRQDLMIGRLGLERAWELSRGAGVVVGVVDSGVDFRHPKLAAAVDPGRQIVTVRSSSGFVVQNIESLDCDRHGTLVAGLIAARPVDTAGVPDDRIVGVAPDARILPIRLVGGIEQSARTAVAAGIREAVNGGARVLNLSFASPVDDPDIRSAVEYALSRDVVVVAAVGNEQEIQPGEIWYPAAYPGVIGVAGLDTVGEPMAESNRTDYVDIAALGEGMNATSPGGSGYENAGGTSFATALVSGTAALVRSRFPQLTAPQVAEHLLGSAVPTGAGPLAVGAGALDPFGALTYQRGSAERTAETDDVVAAPVPPVEPLLRPGLGTAVAWTAGLAGVGVIALIAGPVVRRAARRGWSPDPDVPDPLTISERERRGPTMPTEPPATRLS